MTIKTQEQGKEERAYNLLKKARQTQGLPLNAPSTLSYKRFDSSIFRKEHGDFTGNEELREYNHSGSDEKEFVEQRWLTRLPKDKFRIANTYFRNDHEGCGYKGADPVAKKLVEMEHPREKWGEYNFVKDYYLGKLRARTMTEEEYNFVLNTPMDEVVDQTQEKLEGIARVEDLPFEVRLKNYNYTKDLTIDPLTLGLANKKTLDNIKEWISQDEAYWAEEKPKLESALYDIKNKQGLLAGITKRKRHKNPHDCTHNCSYVVDRVDGALMNWSNHELDYVVDRHSLGEVLANPSKHDNGSKIPKSMHEYHEDPVCMALFRLGSYVREGSELEGADAMRRFVEASKKSIINRSMKKRDYEAILGIKKWGEFYELARKEGEKIPAKKEKIRRKYRYISPLTLKLLLNQMKNFVENRGSFPDKSKKDDMFSELI